MDGLKIVNQEDYSLIHQFDDELYCYPQLIRSRRSYEYLEHLQPDEVYSIFLIDLLNKLKREINNYSL